MKRLFCATLALVMMLTFASCGGAKLEGVEAPIDILNTVWGTYGENEAFFATGGDYNNMVDNAPGAVDVSDAATLQSLFACGEEPAAMIDGAASLIHGMNANSFTGVAYHLNGTADAAAFATAMQASIAANQWMCGAPEKLFIASLSPEYVVVAYGASDIVNTFKDKVIASYATTTVLVEEDLFV